MKRRPLLLIVVFIAAIFCILFFCVGGKDNSEKIKAIKSLEIYDADPFAKNGNISNVAKVTIDKATLDKMFNNIKFHKGSILWKGQFLGVGKLDDSNTVKLAISYYGGYFKIMGESGYYQTKGKSYEIFEKTRKQIVNSEFIPARKRVDNAEQAMADTSILCMLAGTRGGLSEEPNNGVVSSSSTISEKITIYKNGKFESKYYILHRVLNGKVIPNDVSEHLLAGHLPQDILASINKEVEKSKSQIPIFEYDSRNSYKMNPTGVNDVIWYIDQAMRRQALW